MDMGDSETAFNDDYHNKIDPDPPAEETPTIDLKEKGGAVLIGGLGGADPAPDPEPAPLPKAGAGSPPIFTGPPPTATQSFQTKFANGPGALPGAGPSSTG